MNKDEQDKIERYLEIYADAFNGLVKQVLSLQDGGDATNLPP